MTNLLINDTAPDPKVFVEQIKLIYRALLPILGANLVTSSALFYGLKDVVPQTVLAGWYAIIIFLIVIRVITYVLYQRSFKPDLVKLFAVFYVIGSALSGLAWGIGAVLMFPGLGLEYQLFILFVLAAMGAGSVSSQTTYMPVFLSYFPVSILPIALYLMLTDDNILVSLGIMSAVYVVALVYFGRNINHALLESLNLRFENIDLVKQLRVQKEEAESANISKSKFLAAASHDLRQPLHALTLFTSVLNESIEKPENRKVVNQITASVEALKTLFNALLDLSRLESGIMIMDKSTFRLKLIFNKLVNDFDLQVKEKGLSINWPDNEFSVFSDPTLLEQVLRNYISNAIRYTDKGVIKIECEEVDGSICIHVADTGVGIPLKEQQAIFEEFHQLSNPERDRSKGLGLGLAIVQRAASLLEHEISVESVPGEGSIFSICVEKSEVDDDLSLPKTETENDSGKLYGNHPLIIVIDDEPGAREGTQQLLQLWGCKVITAADEEGALTQLHEQGLIPDGIIADYRLRENKTGVEAIHAIYKAFDTEVPALIVTGDIAVEKLNEAKSGGIQVLPKPVASIKLRTFIRYLQRKRA